MGLSSKQKKALDEFLISAFERKVENFEVSKSMDNSFAHATVMPEKYRRIFSTVHSWSTAFGMGFFEQIAQTLAVNSGKECELQWHAPKQISKDRVEKIEDILRENVQYFKTKGKTGRKPDVDNAIKEILDIPNQNLVNDENDNIVDIYFDNNYLIDSKTVKINKDLWIELKKKTLRWVARMDRPVKAVIGLPYNPNGSEPYSAIGFEIMELDKNLLIGKNYWDIFGEGCYEDLTSAFKKIGNEYFEKTLEKAGVK